MHRYSQFGLTILLLSVAVSGSTYAQVLSSERERALKPKDSFKECETCPEMVVVPAGSFLMGSPASEKGRDDHEGPQRQITFAKAFAVARFEVTLDQFSAFVAQTGHQAGASVPEEGETVLPKGTCETTQDGDRKLTPGRSFQNPGFPQTGTHPVTCVSWRDAKAYVAWLSKTTGKDYRLLTEAEWEYAARARTAPGPGPRYSFGDDDNAMCKHGNGADQSAKATAGALESFKQKSDDLFPCSDGHAYTAPAGSFAANEFGLHDMHGNVWEMIEDCYGSYERAPKDGSAAESAQLYCAAHVVRGGSWNNGSDGPYSLRAASRPWNSVDWPENNKGFRVARALSIP